MNASPDSIARPTVRVACPHCTNALILPGPLAGPWGTRVLCPACEEPFLVPAEGLRVARHVERAGPEVEAEARRTVEERHAFEAVAYLVENGGEGIAQAAAEGRLFSDGGPRLFAAFDDYRARAGAAADPAAFRRALREKLGVDLDPPAPKGGR